MPPTTIVDTSLPPNQRDIYYVIEDASIWKTTDLTAVGAATWTELYTASTFESVNGVTVGHFCRIIAPTVDLIYVLGYASTDDIPQPWILISSNGGLSWNAVLIDDDELQGAKDYTVTHETLEQVTPTDSWPYWSCSAEEDVEFTRIGDDGNTYNPIAIAVKFTAPVGQYEYVHGHFVDAPSSGNIVLPDADGILNHGYISLWSQNALLGSGNDLMPNDGEYGDDRLDDYFGAGNWTSLDIEGDDWYTPLDEGRINFRLKACSQMAGLSVTTDLWVFWDFPSDKAPRGFDVAETNNSWLYVGLTDKIKASEDGGYTWFDFYTDHGANDICVDPQLAGAIYYWATDGNLNLLMKQTLGAAGVLTSEGLMTETPLAVPLRIARDVNSGRLLALPNGTTLTMHNLGSNTNLKTGLSGARGLHAYLGQKIIFVDSSDIYISDDIQAVTPTITAKKGGWVAYASGINSHRMTAP